MPGAQSAGDRDDPAVTYEAESSARNRTAAATSSAVPGRASAVLASACSRRVSVMSWTMSVSIRPGDTTLTVMLRRPTSMASDRAKPISAALDEA